MKSKKKRILMVVFIILGLALAACSSKVSATSTLSNAVQPTNTEAPTIQATHTQTLVVTDTQTPTATGTQPVTPTDTQLSAPTDTQPPAPTDTLEPVPTSTQPPVPTDTQAPAFTETVPPTVPEGEALLNQRCTVCHNLNRVVSKRLTADEWKQIVNRMINKGAKLSSDEFQILVEYLVRTYGP